MFVVSKSFNILLISFLIPDFSSKYLYAVAVIENPLGIGTPFFESVEYISPKEAFFPPTSGTSLIVVSLNHKINFFLFCALTIT